MEDKGLLFEICMFLPTSCILLKMAGLTKKVSLLVKSLHKLDRLWYARIIDEWISVVDRSRMRYDPREDF